MRMIALAALAVGFVLSDSAHAANVEWEAAMQSCLKVFDNNNICLMHTAATEQLAQEFRRGSTWACAQTVTGDGTPIDKAWCAEIRAYILGRWGY